MQKPSLLVLNHFYAYPLLEWEVHRVNSMITDTPHPLLGALVYEVDRTRNFTVQKRWVRVKGKHPDPLGINNFIQSGVAFMNRYSMQYIEPLIANIQESGRTVQVVFQCPISGIKSPVAQCTTQ